ncbi:MAG: ABC transporter ATP-binding protein/permease [Lachnospiraceae bacterium]|nr:ABC transporter ATP-binding protein/permease [Lachnospiraceae bacterium]
MMENKEKTVRLPLFGLPKLWPFIKKYKGMFIGMIVAGIVYSVFDAIYPLFNKYAITHFVGDETLDTIGWFIGGYVLITVVQCIINYINVMLCAKLELYMDRDLRNGAFSHLQQVSLSYFNRNNVGYIHARVMSDTGKIGELVAWQLMDVVWWGSYVILALVVMFFVNARMALYLLILLPIAVLVTALFQKKLVVYNRQMRELNSQITSDINEGITGVKSIKTLAIADKINREFKNDTDKMYKKSIKTTHHSALFTSIMTMLSTIALALILWKGGMLTVEGLIEIGTLSVFMSYALGMLEPIQFIINSISRMIAVGVNIERYMELVNTVGEVYDSPEVIEKYGDSFNPKYENFEELKGEVEFKDVTFKYPDGEEIVLDNFNLKVKKGQSVAIVGETGAGKSTLVNLVCRFFEPTKGQVLIDGRDAKERSLKWLHSNIGYVLQTPYLFSGTVRDNLIYGKENATEEEIMDALNKVGADRILGKLEKGLDTELGEGGDFLSTGEKQLLSIARALLADPKILILDEATSSVDSVTESAVQQAIATVTEERTSFIIAHRLSTVVGADTILVVADGKIVERGNHKELMKKKGEYYNLYMRQFEELETWKASKGV